VNIEKQCRLTGITDLRFLRASHIKPWSKCADGSERVDGSNGLLLSPHADFLFDRGWITFEDDGALICSDHLPKNVPD
jgi:5-methylcytosine-specific restriction protein A